MAEGQGRSSGQGVKLLYIRDYLHKHTNKEHPKSAKKISAYLATKGIKADRKTIYNDILRLQMDFQEPIEYNPKKWGYYISEPEFTGAELAMLIDCVRYSPFMTKADAFQLSNKIKSLANMYDLPMLQHSEEDFNKQDSDNSILRNIILIMRAIEEKRKLRFQRMQYVAEHSIHTAVEPEIYFASPYQLIWEDGKYLLKCAVNRLPPDPEEDVEDDFDRELDRRIRESYKEKYGDDWERHYNEYLENLDAGNPAEESDEEIYVECNVARLANMHITNLPSTPIEMVDHPEYGTKARKEKNQNQARAITIRFRKTVLDRVAFELGKDAVFIPVDRYHFKTTIRTDIDYSLIDWIDCYGCNAKILEPQEAIDFLLAAKDDSMHDMKILYEHDLEPIPLLEQSEFYNLGEEAFNILWNDEYPKIRMVCSENGGISYVVRKNDVENTD